MKNTRMKNTKIISWIKYTCPHCHQEESIRPDNWNDRQFIDRPHQDPFECISYLRMIITDFVSDVNRINYPDEY